MKQISPVNSVAVLHWITLHAKNPSERPSSWTVAEDAPKYFRSAPEIAIKLQLKLTSKDRRLQYNYYELQI